MLLLLSLSTKAATGIREDDVLLYGGTIAVLALILGILYLIGYIRKRIRNYKEMHSDMGGQITE